MFEKLLSRVKFKPFFRSWADYNYASSKKHRKEDGFQERMGTEGWSSWIRLTGRSGRRAGPCGMGGVWITGMRAGTFWANVKKLCENIINTMEQGINQGKGL